MSEFDRFFCLTTAADVGKFALIINSVNHSSKEQGVFAFVNVLG